MISGVTIIRNAEILGYPVVEAIRSALPLCDEYIVVVGKSEDRTLELIEGINDPRIRIVETEWSDLVMPRDSLLAQQTNIGLHIARGRWAVCLQANEVIHEDSLPNLKALMEKHAEDDRVEALLLERLTFWGDYDHYLRHYPHRFKYSPRIVRPYIGTYAIRDAMSFGVFEGFSRKGRYPRALDTGEDVFRYGFVRSKESLHAKAEKAVHGCRGHEVECFHAKFPKRFVERFQGSHPAVMAELVETTASRVSLEASGWKDKLTWKQRKRWLETRCYERFGIPRFRKTRYRLLGEYQPKERI